MYLDYKETEIIIEKQHFINKKNATEFTLFTYTLSQFNDMFCFFFFS